MLSVNKVIKKRYEKKVDILLTVAEMLQYMGDSQQAYTYFQQAHRYYSQQVADRTWKPEVISLLQRIERIKGKFASIARVQIIKCTIEATTADELEAVVAHHQKNNVRGLEITKGVNSFTRSRDTRAATSYRAHLRFTIQPQQKKGEETV